MYTIHTFKESLNILGYEILEHTHVGFMTRLELIELNIANNPLSFRVDEHDYILIQSITLGLYTEQTTTSSIWYKWNYTDGIWDLTSLPTGLKHTRWDFTTDRDE